MVSGAGYLLSYKHGGHHHGAHERRCVNNELFASGKQFNIIAGKARQLPVEEVRSL